MHDDFYQMYLEELELITPYTGEEAEVLAQKSLAGDEDARRKLIEGGLHEALQIAEAYEGRGLAMGDLVQEANMALTMAAGSYPGGSWKEYMEQMAREAIEAALNDQDAEQQAEEVILARVNVLKDISQSMAEELGREATVEELAARMKMEPDEIRDIMKVTLDALSVSTEA